MTRSSNGYTIRTARLFLRPVILDDDAAAVMFALRSDPEVFRYT